jgi:hypothetical protein
MAGVVAAFGISALVADAASAVTSSGNVTYFASDLSTPLTGPQASTQVYTINTPAGAVCPAPTSQDGTKWYSFLTPSNPSNVLISLGSGVPTGNQPFGFYDQTGSYFPTGGVNTNADGSYPNPSATTLLEWDLGIVLGNYSEADLTGGTSKTWDSGLACIRPTRTATDIVMNSGSTTITSPSTNFLPSDVGLPVTGTGITGGTTIASVTNPTTAVLSLPATATTRVVTDGVTTVNSPNISSATANFVAPPATPNDVGATVSGAGIPAGTPTNPAAAATIASVTSSTAAVLNKNATATATGVTLTIGNTITIGAPGQGHVTAFWDEGITFNHDGTDPNLFKWTAVAPPPPNVPESPLAVALPLGGAAVLGLGVLINRRRIVRSKGAPTPAS